MVNNLFIKRFKYYIKYNKMDILQYEQYSCVIKNGTLSMDALKRIIDHDCVSGWENNSDCLARKQVLADCKNGVLIPKKLH